MLIYFYFCQILYVYDIYVDIFYILDAKILLATFLGPDLRRPEVKKTPKLKSTKKAKDVLEEVEDFSYAQLEEEHVQVEVVKSSGERT